MAVNGFIFDARSVDLIRRVVKQVLGEPGNVTGDRLPYRRQMPPNVLFEVDLVQDDGGATAQGSDSTTASFTYKIRNVGQTTDLATAKSPLWGRWNGQRNVASKGAAFYDNAGTLQLAFAYEVLVPSSSSGGTSIGIGLALQVYQTNAAGTAGVWDWVRSH